MSQEQNFAKNDRFLSVLNCIGVVVLLKYVDSFAAH